MADQSINLILGVKGAEQIDALRARLEGAVSGLNQVASVEERASIALAQFDEEERQAAADMDRFVTEMQRALAVEDAFAEGGTKIAQATGKQSGGAGFAILDLSRGLEDLQYGFSAVLNNIPQFSGDIARLAGLSTEAAAAWSGGIALVALAAYELYQHWDDVVGLFESKNPVPATTDSLKAAEIALKENSKALDEFKGKTSLSNDELARFNELTEKQSILEANLAEERKLRSTIQRGLEAVPAEQQALAQANLAAQAGRGVEVQRAIRDELQRRAEADIAEAQATLPEAIAEATAGLRPGIDIGEITRRRVLIEQRQAEFERETRAGVGSEAQRLYAGFLTGQPGATADVMGILRGTGYLADVAQRAEELSPAGKANAKLVDMLNKQGEQAERWGDEQARKQEENAKKEDDRRTDLLNKTGAHYERLGQETADKQDEQAKKEADRQEKQANRNEDRAFETQAAIDRRSIEGEARRIRGVYGPEFQREYEANIAQNRITGAIPEADLAAQLQGQMARVFEQAGASAEGAGYASQLIAQSGANDLQRRTLNMTSLGMSAQEQTLALTRELGAEIQQLMMKQLQLMGEAGIQRGMAVNRRAHGQSALRFRVNGGF